MSKLVMMAGCLMIGGVLAGCDRSSYESAPVVLKGDYGELTCQLYTVERVMWDEAVLYPDTLTKEQADALCFAEGERRLGAFKAAKKTSG